MRRRRQLKNKLWEVWVRNESDVSRKGFNMRIMRLRRKGRLVGRWILRQSSDSKNYKFGHNEIIFTDGEKIIITYKGGPRHWSGFSVTRKGGYIWIPILWRWLIRRKMKHIYLDNVNEELNIW